MGELERRLRRLEDSLSPRHVDTGAKARFSAKLAAISEHHRTRRERGEEPVLEDQSFASLLGLVESYPRGAVPPEVVEAARSSAEEKARGPRSVAAKMMYLCLRSKGAA